MPGRSLYNGFDSITDVNMFQSSNSISMLPSEPKIFYGRESELANILELLSQKTPRIAILGAGGMGKTSLARTVLHHIRQWCWYEKRHYFVACDSVATKAELVGLVGDHLGLKSGKDLACPVVQHFSQNPPSLLILDNLETLWESTKFHNEIKELLSLLTNVGHLALIVGRFCFVTYIWLITLRSWCEVQND